MTAAGAVQVKAPRVNDKRIEENTGERRRFRSQILPPWCRRSPRVAKVLPLLYLHGLSTGDFVPALEQFLGSAAGLSSATITRLTKQWADDYHAFCQRDLSGVDYVYVWVDGIHVNIGLGEDKLCLLVVVGVRADGSKQLVALADGYRESAGSWADLLRDCARRGLRAPVLAIGDGALGFWAALREVLPDTPEHWIHLLTSNPIESTFATVRHRTRVTKGPGSRAAGWAMAFKLVEPAQDRWRAVNAPHLVALVRAGAKFHNGQLVERPEAVAA